MSIRAVQATGATPNSKKVLGQRPGTQSAEGVECSHPAGRQARKAGRRREHRGGMAMSVGKEISLEEKAAENAEIAAVRSHV